MGAVGEQPGSRNRSSVNFREATNIGYRLAPDPLPQPLLAGLLWAAYGVNRPEGGRTAPTAINAQEIDVQGNRI